MLGPRRLGKSVDEQDHDHRDDQCGHEVLAVGEATLVVVEGTDRTGGGHGDRLSDGQWRYHTLKAHKYQCIIVFRDDIIKQ